MSCQQCNHHRYKCNKQSNENIYKIISAFIQIFIAHEFSKTVTVLLICFLLGNNRSKLHIAFKFLQNSITTCFYFDETSSHNEDGCWKKYIQIPRLYLSSSISERVIWMSNKSSKKHWNFLHYGIKRMFIELTWNADWHIFPVCTAYDEYVSSLFVAGFVYQMHLLSWIKPRTNKCYELHSM
jgi:hypothetical protein